MIVRYPGQRRDDDEEQQRSPHPPFERCAVPEQDGARSRPARIGKLLTHHVTAKAVEHLRALDDVDGQDDEADPVPPQQCQQHPACRRRCDPAPQGQQRGGDRRGGQCRAGVCVYGPSSARAVILRRGAPAFTSSIEGLSVPVLFFLLKPHRSLKNFPAGSLRSASTVR